MKRGMRRVILGIVPVFLLATLLHSPLGGGAASAAPGAPQAPLVYPEPPIVDSFNRPNENPLSDGGKWANLGGSYPLEVVSNQVKSSNSTAQAWRNDVRYGLDQDVMVTIVTEPNADSSNGCASSFACSSLRSSTGTPFATPISRGRTRSTLSASPTAE